MDRIRVRWRTNLPLYWRQSPSSTHIMTPTRQNVKERSSYI